MNLSQLIVGIFMVAGGLTLIVISVIKWIVALLLWGVPILIIGLIILFNKREDAIEQIKKVKRRKNG